MNYSGFWMWALPMVVLWWIFASFMLYVVWNQVITAVTSVKEIQLGQALLLVFTLGVLCAPAHMRHCAWGARSCHGQGIQIWEEQEDIYKVAPPKK